MTILDDDWGGLGTAPPRCDDEQMVRNFREQVLAAQHAIAGLLSQLSKKQRSDFLGAAYETTKTGLFGLGGPYFHVGRAINDAFAINGLSVLSAQKLKALKNIVINVDKAAAKHSLSFDAGKIIKDLEEGYRGYAGLNADRRTKSRVVSLSSLAKLWDETARGQRNAAFKPSVAAKALLKEFGAAKGGITEVRDLRDLDVWRHFLSHHTYQQMVAGNHEIAVARSRHIEELVLLGRDEVAGSDAVWFHQLDGLLVTNGYLAHRMGRREDEHHYLYQMRRCLRPDATFLHLGLSRHMFYQSPTHAAVDGAVAMVSGGRKVTCPGMTFADGGILAYAAISQILRGIPLSGQSGNDAGSPEWLLNEAADRQERIGDTEGSIRFRVLLAQALVREDRFDTASKTLRGLEVEIDACAVEMVHAMALIKEGWAYWSLRRHMHDAELAVTSATSHMSDARRLTKRAGLSATSSNYLINMEHELNSASQRLLN